MAIPLGRARHAFVGRAGGTALELDLPVDHASVREARQFVADFDGLDADRLADAQLVTSELVTNALLHAGLRPGARIVLTLARHGNRLRIDVDDAGSFTADGETFIYPKGIRRVRGRGLLIVQRLALHWQADNGRVTAWLKL